MTETAARKPGKALVIQNPTAGPGRRRYFERSLALIEESGWQIVLEPTAARGDGEAFAKRARSQGYDLIIAAGGDGTINEVINGLLSDEGSLSGAPPLAILPQGTANVLAAEIGLKLEAEAFVRMVNGGAVVKVGVGLLKGDGHFGAMAGVGFDARVVDRVSLPLKRKIGKGAYACSAAAQLLKSQTRYRVAVDGAPHEAASVIVSKGRFYAGQFLLAPQARLEDPYLHVCLFERSGRWNLLRYALAMQLGRLESLPDFKIVTGRIVEIEGPEGDPVQADGDVVGHLPARIELREAALSLLVPPGY